MYICLSFLSIFPLASLLLHFLVAILFIIPNSLVRSLLENCTILGIETLKNGAVFHEVV
uniref:Uncharacterized protein n=1 Tax=Rhizophora mucronata TaxID=61149 RepID=A0A2P2KYM3_RHIMU